MDPILGEIKLFPYGVVPQGWHLCDGAVLTIQQYAALYSLLGVTYGGNGSTTFALPDLRGRTFIASGNTPQRTAPDGLGYAGGAENVTLTAANMPPHVHAVNVNNATGTLNAVQTTNIYAGSANGNLYAPANSTPTQAIDPRTLQPVGGGAGHSNMQPFTVVQFCIAMEGVYPQRP